MASEIPFEKEIKGVLKALSSPKGDKAEKADKIPEQKIKAYFISRSGIIQKITATKVANSINYNGNSWIVPKNARWQYLTLEKYGFFKRLRATPVAILIEGYPVAFSIDDYNKIVLEKVSENGEKRRVFVDVIKESEIGTMLLGAMYLGKLQSLGQLKRIENMMVIVIIVMAILIGIEAYTLWNLINLTKVLKTVVAKLAKIV